MTPFQRFAMRCKMRHDYGDMFQIRLNHPNGDHYDTWVSGEEVSSRLRSMAAEERIRALRRLDFKALRKAREQLEIEGKRKAQDKLRDQVGDTVEDFLGDNDIAESLASAIRGDNHVDSSDQSGQWKDRLKDDEFKAILIELAWIQLEGSFPRIEADQEPGDWETFE